MEVSARPDSLLFDFYGVRLRLDSDDPGMSSRLEQDFSYFQARGPEPVPADIRITLSQGAPAPLPAGSPSWSTSQYSAYDRGDLRWVDYGGRARCRYDFAAERGRLWCADPDLMHELAYLLIHSRAGEWLDRRGLHRIHALGVEVSGEGAVLVAPSGGGKTTLCLELLGRPGVRLLSEDTPLIDAAGTLHPFPLRLGVCPDETKLAAIPPDFQRPFLRRRHGPKVLIGLEYFGERIAGPCPTRRVFILERRKSGPRIARAGLPSVLASLGSALVLGVGVPQVLEYFLRADGRDLLGKSRLAWNRLKAAFHLFRNARFYRFGLCPDPPRNAQAFLNFLQAS